jgi:hypothetical protein
MDRNDIIATLGTSIETVKKVERELKDKKVLDDEGHPILPPDALVDAAQNGSTQTPQVRTGPVYLAPRNPKGTDPQIMVNVNDIVDRMLPLLDKNVTRAQLVAAILKTEAERDAYVNMGGNGHQQEVQAATQGMFTPQDLLDFRSMMKEAWKWRMMGMTMGPAMFPGNGQQEPNGKQDLLAVMMANQNTQNQAAQNLMNSQNQNLQSLMNQLLASQDARQ